MSKQFTAYSIAITKPQLIGPEYQTALPMRSEFWKAPWAFGCVGQVVWDGNSRDDLRELDKIKGFYGLWYPELGYLMVNHNGYFVSHYFPKGSSKYRLLEMIRTGQNPEPVSTNKLRVESLVSQYSNGELNSSKLRNHTLYTCSIMASYASVFGTVYVYVKEDIGFRNLYRECAYPVTNGVVTRGSMSGNYLTSSDSRFKEFFGGLRTLPVHENEH